MTKYDCSSADVNLIGGICKVDLGNFLLWAAEEYGYKSLLSTVAAPPSAELRPMVIDPVNNVGLATEHTQTDEVCT